jgi:hypothetical protein
MIRLANSFPYLPVSNSPQNVRTVIEPSIDRLHWGLAKIYTSEVLPSDKTYFFVDGPNIQVVLARSEPSWSNNTFDLNR